ncbi:MAG: type I restriction enzyme HsdR N-terminal domain-containing protein [Leadbetterella sp.]|nr:type I restriction enzyme HsdR N-terminal domain-containing protein [Leadbetterella sp.]
MKSLKTKTEDGITYVYDIIRKKYLVLTPEEKVRQTFLHFLVSELGFPASLIRTELGTRYHALAKRTDILVFDKTGQPYMLVECKAADVKISAKVIEQASRYNRTLKAPYLCVTNGRNTYCFRIDFESGDTTQLESLPNPGL